MPFGGPTHERLARVDDECPQTTSSGDVWAQTQHGTCNSSANATGFDRALTYSPPFFVRAHQTTKEDCTPGTLKASQVALVEPVAYLKDLVRRAPGRHGPGGCVLGSALSDPDGSGQIGHTAASAPAVPTGGRHPHKALCPYLGTGPDVSGRQAATLHLECSGAGQPALSQEAKECLPGADASADPCLLGLGYVA